MRFRYFLLFGLAMLLLSQADGIGQPPSDKSDKSEKKAKKEQNDEKPPKGFSEAKLAKLADVEEERRQKEMQKELQKAEERRQKEMQRERDTATSSANEDLKRQRERINERQKELKDLERTAQGADLEAIRREREQLQKQDQWIKDTAKLLKPPPSEEERLQNVVKDEEKKIRKGEWREAEMERDRFKEGTKFFADLDRDRDGFLAGAELQDGARQQGQRFDANYDGALDVREYSEYFAARVGQMLGAHLDQLDRPFPSLTPGGEESKPVVHVGKLPPGLPSWFQKLDSDHDRQVALYEWRAAQAPVSEYFRFDRNDDGFITPDEALRTLAAPHTPSPVESRYSFSFEPIDPKGKENKKGK